MVAIISKRYFSLNESLAVGEDGEALLPAKVRKMSSWPRSWADLSLL
jgi:hypothetical protein